MRMSDKNFYQLWGEALTSTDRDFYVSEWSTSSLFPEDSDLLENAEYLGKLWDVAHMSVKGICKAAGLTQAALAQRFCIPKRTVEDWCGERRACSDYIRLMMAECLGLLSR